MGPELISPLVGIAKLMKDLVTETKASGRASVQSLMSYSTAIEQGVHGLLNEIRELLVISRADLDDDQSMSRLRLRIQTYLDVHQVYEPLRLAVTEVEATLDELDQKSDSLLGIRDLSGKRRAALRDREDFLEVHGFLDRLEQITKYLPYRTGYSLEHWKALVRLSRRPRESHLAKRQGRATGRRGFARASE